MYVPEQLFLKTLFRESTFLQYPGHFQSYILVLAILWYPTILVSFIADGKINVLKHNQTYWGIDLLFIKKNRPETKNH